MHLAFVNNYLLKTYLPSPVSGTGETRKEYSFSTYSGSGPRLHARDMRNFITLHLGAGARQATCITSISTTIPCKAPFLVFQNRILRDVK